MSTVNDERKEKEVPCVIDMRRQNTVRVLYICTEYIEIQLSTLIGAIWRQLLDTEREKDKCNARLPRYHIHLIDRITLLTTQLQPSNPPVVGKGACPYFKDVFLKYSAHICRHRTHQQSTTHSAICSSGVLLFAPPPFVDVGYTYVYHSNSLRRGLQLSIHAYIDCIDSCGASCSFSRRLDSLRKKHENCLCSCGGDRLINVASVVGIVQGLQREQHCPSREHIFELTSVYMLIGIPLDLTPDWHATTIAAMGLSLIGFKPLTENGGFPVLLLLSMTLTLHAT